MMDYTKAIMGENAIHLPFNFVRMDHEGKGLVLGQDAKGELSFDSCMAFILVKGDMIFRPHLIIESNHPAGMGASAIITSSTFCDVDEWKREGKVLFKLKS